MKKTLKNITDTALFKSFFPLCRKAESAFGDWIMNVKTSGPVQFNTVRGANCDALNFQVNAHTTIIKTINQIKLNENDIVYVLGCGKGRTVCHFARKKIQKVIGIELDKDLSEIAKQNINSLRCRRAEAEIINNDAIFVDMSRGTVFFLFNPFGETTLRNVLKNIETSHNKETSVTIVYVNPVYKKVFDESTWLVCSNYYVSIAGLQIMIYNNRS